MDIFWYSPTDIESTEIARYSAQVLPFIAARANVVGVHDGKAGGDQDPTRRMGLL